MRVQGCGADDKVRALLLDEDRNIGMSAMRTSLLAIVVLLGGSALAQADDVPQAMPAAPGAPVKIIDARPAPEPAQEPAPKTDQALPTTPPMASSRAKAPERAAEEPAGTRFSFVRVDDGFLRFDLTTGQVAYCNPHPEGWGCQAVPENRSALEREVTRLRDEVATLKREIESLREPPPPRPPAPVPPASSPPPATQGDITRDAPGHDDIARAKAVLRDVWQRFVTVIVGFKNDVLRQS